MKTIGLTFTEKPAEVCICLECGKEYKTPAALNKHLEKEHAEVKKNDGAAGEV